MRILIADDSQVSRTVLTSRLAGQGYDIEVAEDGTEAWERLSADDPPEIAVIDWMMPGMEGIEICRRLRALETDTYTYLILVTMRERAEDIAAGLEAGADDFVAKPFEPIELDARIRVGARLVRNAQRLRAANEELRRIATTDPVTRLFNRAAIVDRIDAEFNRHAREGKPVGVLMVDVDSFKQHNDEHGHAAGDDVLRLTAAAIQSAVRIYDLVGRYGGDEFLVVLPGADSRSAAVVGERVRAAVAAIDRGDGAPGVTVSVGAASWSREHDAAPEATLRAADEALYRAKASGRNLVCVATPDDVSDAAGAGGAPAAR